MRPRRTSQRKRTARPIGATIAAAATRYPAAFSVNSHPPRPAWIQPVASASATIVARRIRPGRFVGRSVTMTFSLLRAREGCPAALLATCRYHVMAARLLLSSSMFGRGSGDGRRGGLHARHVAVPEVPHQLHVAGQAPL